jgi:ABC-type amino acid transport system permease subunit
VVTDKENNADIAEM